MIQTMPPSSRSRLALGAALFFAWPGAASPVGAQTVAERVAAFVENVRLEWGAPAVSAAVSLDGRIVFAEGAGWADIADSVPAAPETVYRIASTSKAITATAVLQLVERGVISLDDDIRRYVPEFPAKRWPITVRHVLTHTSGVRHYGPGETSRKTVHYTSVAEALSLFADDSLLFEPGTAYGYTTYGYTLLQGVIEAATDMPFREYLRRNVWQPAGMTRSDLEVKGDSYPHRATGHNRPGGTVRPVPFDDVSFKYAGGGMLSSAVDLVRFCSALFTGGLLTPEWVDASVTPQIPHVRDESGYAWGVRRDRAGRRIIWHPGRSYGFESQLLCYPEQRLAVAVLTNQDWTNPWREVGGLADFLAHIFLPDTEVPAEAVPMIPVATAVRRALDAGDPDSAARAYRAYLANPHYRYGEPAVDVDALGRRLLGEGRLNDGAALLRLNAELHPRSWRTWVSAGDAALARGALDDAERAYRRVLALRADASQTRRKLDWLGRRDTTAAFDPTGRWELETFVSVGGRERSLSIEVALERQDGQLSGQMTSAMSGTTPVHTVVTAGNALWLVSPIPDGLLELELTVAEGAVTGRWRLGPQSGVVSGRRSRP